MLKTKKQPKKIMMVIKAAEVSGERYLHEQDVKAWVKACKANGRSDAYIVKGMLK